MIDAPHPALRRLWMEASSAGRAMSEICVLQRAWNSLLNSNLDLPILESEELVQPLLQFGPFTQTINAALARYDAEHDLSQGAQVTASHQLRTPVSDVRSEKSGVSLPREVEPKRPRLAAPSSSNQATAGKIRENPLSTIAKIRENTLSTIAGTAEFTSLLTADSQTRTKPVSGAETVSLVDNKFRDDIGEIAEVERAVRDSVRRETSWPIPETPAMRRTSEVTTFESQPVIPVPVTSGEKSAPRSISTATLSGAKPRRATAEPLSYADKIATSVEAEEIRADRKNRVAVEATQRGNLFEQVLGAAVERLARQAPRSQLSTGPPSVKANRGEDALIDREVYPEGRHDFRRSALARLAATAIQSGGRPAREIRATHEREGTSFAAATCFADSDGAQFASHLNTLLRQEILRHGISLEDLD